MHTHFDFYYASGKLSRNGDEERRILGENLGKLWSLARTRFSEFDFYVDEEIEGVYAHEINRILGKTYDHRVSFIRANLQPFHVYDGHLSIRDLYLPAVPHIQVLYPTQDDALLWEKLLAESH